MRKRFKTLLAAILLSFSSLFAAACSGVSTITGIHMTNEEVMNVPFGNFTYDGVKVTVTYDDGTDRQIDLTSDMISEAEQLKFFKIGEQEVKVTYDGYYTTTMKINVVLNEFNDVYELVGYTCVYDGNPHEVKLNHELPEGATIVYPKGNVFTNAGKYEVTGVITKSGYVTKTLTATLTILENKHDEDSIVFADKTVPFNGEAQTIEAENVPEGVSVSYTLYDGTKTSQLNKAYYAGKYVFVAHFTNDDPNYKQIEDREAVLTIEKIDYDLSEIKFLDVIKIYDGQSYTPSIINKEALPQGLFVHYEIYDSDGNPVTDTSASGKYTMKAVFTGGDVNHNAIEPMVATLTVSKKIVYIKDTLDFDGKEVTFSGEAIFVSDPAGLPSGVEFSLDQNGFTYAGEYPVVATFTTVDKNNTVDLPSTTVYVIIKPANSGLRVFDGLDSEKEPIYHDFTFKDIDIDVANNTATINYDDLRLDDDFLDIDCGITENVDEDPLTFRQAIIDPTTKEETYITVEPKDFAVGNTYEFSVGFTLTNDDEEIEGKLNESLLISPISGSFKYDRVSTKSGDYEYEGTFDASNIIISDDVASIVGVESGVTVDSIVFIDPMTDEEVDASELVLDYTYNYKVDFTPQDSAIYIDETGTFTYKKVTFSTANLLVLDGSASLVDVEDGANIQSIVVRDKVEGKEVKLSELVPDQSYDYDIVFTSVGEVGDTPGTIWRAETGSFTYERVVDSTSGNPITAKNISLAGDTASILNIDSGITVDSIKFYKGITEIDVSDLQADDSYNYVISFRSSNTKVYAQEKGIIRVGAVTTKGNSGEYNAPFTISNLLITNTAVGNPSLVISVRDLNTSITIKAINIYDISGDLVDANALIVLDSYTYEVIFNNSDTINYRAETGSFIYRKIMNISDPTHPSDFSTTANLKIKDGVASLVGVTEGIEVLSIKIYNSSTKEEISDLTALVDSESYYSVITVMSQDGSIWMQQMDLFVYPTGVITE